MSLPLFAALLLASSTSPSKADLPCAPLPGVDSLLAKNLRIGVGEVHGNDATPVALLALVCHAAKRGPVHVALEMPMSEQERLSTFLASKGSPSDRATLLRGPFWGGPFPDGRGSDAMATFLENLRALRSNGAALKLDAYDVELSEQGPTRDAGMARNLASRLAKAPNHLFVVLAGNLHTRKAPIPANEMVFMAQHLVKQGISLTTVLAKYSEGSSWMCMSGEADECGPAPTGRGPDAPLSVRLEPTDDGAYDGVLVVGAPRWSRPAARPLSPRQQKRVDQFADRLKARRAYDARDYKSCAQAYVSLGEAYEAACCLALGGKPAEAFEQLVKVVAARQATADDLENDADLVSLQKDQRWADRFESEHELYGPLAFGAHKKINADIAATKAELSRFRADAARFAGRPPYVAPLDSVETKPRQAVEDRYD